MSEIKKQENQNQNGDQDRSKNQEQVNPLNITFKKPYTFEGKVYNGIDLSPMEDMTGNDFIKIEKEVRQLGINNLNPETTAEGAYTYAARAAGVPFEFFSKLPLKEARRTKAVVVNFLWS
jgi:hypothetical protein